MNKKNLILTFGVVSFNSYSMHIMEGYLSFNWAMLWWLVSLPFLLIGSQKVAKLSNESLDKKLLLALACAFVFLLSAMKLPSVTGSSSHPTGIGFGAILLGPFVMSIVGSIVLLFQALLLAHGGLTTLGANIFSMAIVGSLLASGVYLVLKDRNKVFAIFLASFIANIGTYATTSIQLALAHSNGNFSELLSSFLGLFAITQVPIAIIEGIVTVLIFTYLPKRMGYLGGVKNA